MASLLGYEFRCKDHCEGRSEACDSELETHSKGQGATLEPLGDAAVDRGAGDFAAEAEEHAARVGEIERMFSARQERKQHKSGSCGHHNDEKASRYPDTPLVQKNASEDQSAEDAEHAVSAGVNSVFRLVPSQGIPLGRIKDEGYAGEDVVEVVRREHRYYKTSEGGPREPPAQLIS